MNRNLLVLFIGFLVLLSVESKAQSNFDPNVIILVPNEVQADKSTNKEIGKINKMLTERISEQAKSEDELNERIKGRPENVGIMLRNTAEFSKNLDFYSMMASMTEQFLQYKFFERFPNLLIQSKHEKSDGSSETLNAIAQKYDAQFIINLKTVKTFKSKNSNVMELEVQLFDVTSNSILLEKTYRGDATNSGFEFACEDGTISCCANNAMKAFIFEAIKLIAENSPALKRSVQLEKDRKAILTNEYYPKPPNKTIVDKIDSGDSTINTQSFYHGFMNSDNTKFVGFFAENSTGKSYKDFQNKYGDRSISLTDDFMSNPPNMYCFIVYGVFYQDKWYYKKDKVTHFKAANFEQGKRDFFLNLRDWDFFEEFGEQASTDFWETNFFAKVADLTKDPDWDKYGESIWKTKEMNNRPYIGLYELVADGLKDEEEAKNALFESSLLKEYITPFIQNIEKTENYEEVTLKQMSRSHLLIYPLDQKVVLCPYTIKDKGKDGIINYLVLLKTNSGYEVYKWNYLKPEDFKSSSRASFMDQINTLTDWNFSVDTLDDSEFWETYVLVQEKGVFKYLEK